MYLYKKYEKKTNPVIYQRKLYIPMSMHISAAISLTHFISDVLFLRWSFEIGS